MAKYYRKKTRSYYRSRKGKYGRGNTWASNTPALARTALKTAKWVASVINTEYKHVDNTLLLQPNNNVGYTITPLTLILQGDDNTMRNGRSVLLKSLQLQMTARLANSTQGTIRFVLVKDRTCEGVAPTMSDIFKQVAGDEAVTSFRNIDTAPINKYKILWDHRFSLDVDFKDQIYISKYLKFSKAHLKFLGTAGNIASAGPGAIFLCIVATGLGDSFMVDINSRIRYIDN